MQLSSKLGSVLAAFSLAVGLQTAAPVEATVSNPILGSFDPANIDASPYAACIAATLVGNGFTFETLPILSADLGALWTNIPGSVANVCKNAVDHGLNQVCIVPDAGSTCSPSVGATDNATWVAQAQALDAWDLTADNGYWRGSAINHYSTNATPQNGPQASITFNLGQIGLIATGPNATVNIPALPFILYGRTPNGGGSEFHLHISDSSGRTYDGEFCFSTGTCTSGLRGIPAQEQLCIPPVFPGNISNCDASINPSPDGFFAASSHNVRFVPSGSQVWPCPAPSPGAPNDCSGLQITFTFTFHGGISDGGTAYTATSAGMTRLSLQYSTGYATALIDSATWDDPRWQFTSAGGPVQNHDARAQAPPAVINPEPGTSVCLIGLDVFNNNKYCPNWTSSPAPVVENVSTVTQRYVATGDSYSSGEGVPPFLPGTDVTDNVCHRSNGAYAPLVHKFEPLITGDLDFAACSGATIPDYYHANHSNSGEAVAQLDHLASSPASIVSIGIGGNDIGFDAVGTACVDLYPRPLFNPGYHSPCGAYLDQASQDQPHKKINQLSTGLGELGGTYDLPNLYGAVKGLIGSKTRVFVMGYPNPLPEKPTSNCFGLVQYEDLTVARPSYWWYLHTNDMIYMEGVFSHLNTALRSNAIQAGFIFVDNAHTFDRGTLCDSDPLLHGLVVKNKPLPFAVSEFSLHPTDLGQQRLSEALEASIQNPYGPPYSNISQNQTIQQAVSVPTGVQQLAVQTAWPGSDVQVSLVSPSGTVYSRGSAGPGVIHQLTANTETIDIFNPQSGQWTVQLFGANIPAPSEPVNLGITQIKYSDLAPVALISSSVDRGVAPVSVQFSSAGTDAFEGATIASYSWDFGDGSTSSDQNPAHTFTAPGTYTVTLTATDSNGQSGTATQTVSIGASDSAPSAGFDWAAIDPTNSQHVSFDASQKTIDPFGQIASYSWNFADGTQGTGATPDHAFSASGSYAVTLTVTNNGGQTGTTCELVSTGQSSIGTSITPCPPLTIAASDGTMTYGGMPPGVTPNFVGFVDGDTASSLTTQPACTSTGAPTTVVGAYPGATSCSGAVDPKYLIRFQPGTLTVNPAPLTATADNQSIVYGSPIPTPTYQVSGFVNGQNLASSGVTGSAACSTGATTASPSGTYPITCGQGTLNAANYGFTFRPGTLLIVKHPAVVGYTGQRFFSTGAGSTVNVTLTGVLTADPGGNPDLTQAAPVFNLYASGNTTLATPDATCTATVSPGGVVSCSIANLGIDNWTVIMQIPATDGYFAGPSSDAVVVTVYQPTSGTFATGGGWIVDPSYRNMPVGVSSLNNHGNFGFNVRYASGTTTPQGQFVYVFRGADGFDYKINSTSWTGGGASFGANVAAFAGQATVTVIDPATGSQVNGLGGTNFTFRADVTSGSIPTFALSVYDSAGNLYHQAGSPGVQIRLGGGSEVIHN